MGSTMWSPHTSRMRSWLIWRARESPRRLSLKTRTSLCSAATRCTRLSATPTLERPSLSTWRLRAGRLQAGQQRPGDARGALAPPPRRGHSELLAHQLASHVHSRRLRLPRGVQIYLLVVLCTCQLPVS